MELGEVLICQQNTLSILTPAHRARSYKKQANKLVNSLQSLLMDGGSELRQWASNSLTVTGHLSRESQLDWSGAGSSRRQLTHRSTTSHSYSDTMIRATCIISVSRKQNQTTKSQHLQICVCTV